MEPEKLAICKNGDNEALLPRPVGNGMYVVGYVDEVNGAGAAEVAAYVPTRHEVVELVKYWYHRVLDNSWFFFLFGGTGSSEWRVKEFAGRRFERAEAAIGKEAVDAAIKEAREEFRTKVVKDDRLWDIFEHGTEEQWEAVRDEVSREWLEQDAAERTRSR
jgi:truncated hemoglobin YjbI